MRKGRRWLLGMLLGLSMVTFAAAAEPAPFGDFEMTINARVPTRDGIELSARVWRPQGAQKRSTVFVFTPYVADEQHARAKKFVQAGFAYVVVDKRGRGGSGGEFAPLEGAGPDGCDAIDWIRGQPWSDGRVVMRGGSYRGMVQWQIAAQCPDRIAAMVPTASVYPGEDFPALAGAVSYPYVVQWLAFTSDRVSNPQLFGDTAFWRALFLRHHRGELAFADLDDAVGLRSPYFDRWIDSYGRGDAWSHDNPTAAQMASMRMPILSITGYFDGDQLGSLRYYREHLAAQPDGGKPRHHLVMGAWDHAGTRYPAQTVDGLDIGAEGVVDLDQLQIDYFRWVLDGAARPVFLADAVVAYDLVARTWRSAPSLGAAEAPMQRFQLVGSPATTNLYAPGALAPRAGASSRTTFRIDPLAPPAPPVDDPIVNPRGAFAKQARVFQTEPFETAMDYRGRFTADLALAMDTPDADIGLALHAVDPDGAIVEIGFDVIRARFREGGAGKLVAPGGIERYRSTRAWWNSIRLPAGSRLRLVIGPVDSEYWQRNFNSGGRLGYETAHDARVATVTIHHGSRSPSSIDLPIAPAGQPVDGDVAPGLSGR
jgi:putative CocE/NonD family hydrolase